MAGKYDGEVRIRTKFDSGNLTSQIMQVENRMEKTAQKAQKLESAMRELENQKIPTEEYEEVQNQISKAEKKLSSLNDRMSKFLELGGKKNSASFKSMQYDAEDLQKTLQYAKGEQQALIEDGKAFQDVKATPEYQKLSEQLRQTNGEMDVLTKKHSELIAKQQKTGSLGEKAFGKIKSAVQKTKSVISSFFSKLTSGSKKASGLLGTFASRLKGISLSLLVFNWL